MALNPDQYDRGAILEDSDSGDRYDVRGFIGGEAGGRFLVVGKLGEPQAGLVSEDVIRENEGDRYSPLDEDDAVKARQETYDQSQRDTTQDTPGVTSPTSEQTSTGSTEEDTTDQTSTSDTEGTEGTDNTTPPEAGPPAAAPDTSPNITPGTTPEPGGTADSTAPAGPGAGTTGAPSNQ